MVRRKGLSRLLAYVGLIILLIALAFAIVYSRGKEKAPSTEVANLTLSSEAFKDGDNIPVKYTCDGQGCITSLELERSARGCGFLCPDS